MLRRRRRSCQLLRAAPLREEPPADVGDPEPVEELREARLLPRRCRDARSERRGSRRAPRRRSCADASASIDSRISSRSASVQRRSAASRAISGSSASRASSRCAHVVEPDIGDEEAAVDLEVDEAVAREPAERLAHRAARDAERCRRARPGARREPGARRARDDQRADLVVGEADDRADPQRLVAGWGSRSGLAKS